MNLAQALRLGAGYTSLAIAGAGGKTSALFQLARQLLAVGAAPVVLATTSTHLAAAQAVLADQHLILEPGGALEPLLERRRQGVVLVSGPLSGDRLAGLDPEMLARLDAFARAHELPLLIEADGARSRLLKAPAAHEPAIPPFVSHVLLVAGLGGLGKPLAEAWVHRPERFATLSAMKMNDEISAEAIVAVLLHPDGGLKHIPQGARRSVLFTLPLTATPDIPDPSPGLLAEAQRMAQKLLPVYHSALIASLPQVIAAHEPAAAILLAAGGSQRFGQPKQLLLWKNEPLVRHVARQALSAGLSPLIVVTGAASEAVGNALQDLPLQLVHNPGWAQGQSSSLRAGVAALPAACGCVTFLLADQPQIPAVLLRALVELHAATLAPLIAPQAGGRRANPALFDRAVFPDLLALEGDQGGRALFSRYPAAWIPWLDDSILLDVDTPEEYERLLAW